MKSGRAYEDYFSDILDAIGKAERFVAGQSFEQFKADDKTAFAVVRALEIVGEAAKRIPQNVRDNHPNIPWRSMAGMRDKLTHNYFSVNLEVVWKTTIEDLPVLKSAIQQVLSTDQR